MCKNHLGNSLECDSDSESLECVARCGRCCLSVHHRGLSGLQGLPNIWGRGWKGTGGSPKSGSWRKRVLPPWGPLLLRADYGLVFGASQNTSVAATQTWLSREEEAPAVVNLSLLSLQGGRKVHRGRGRESVLLIRLRLQSLGALGVLRIPKKGCSPGDHKREKDQTLPVPEE